MIDAYQSGLQQARCHECGNSLTAEHREGCAWAKQLAMAMQNRRIEYRATSMEEFQRQQNALVNRQAEVIATQLHPPSVGPIPRITWWDRMRIRVRRWKDEVLYLQAGGR